MLSKAWIKRLNALLQKKQRNQSGQFRVEGSNNVIDFLQGPLDVLALWATDSWVNQHSVLLEHVPEITRVSLDEMKKITALTTPSEVLALFSLPVEEHTLWRPDRELILALDDIHDPGNLGTIIRTADWFGIRKIWCSNNTVDAYSPKVVQASMGSLARVEIRYTELKETLNQVPYNTTIYGAVLNGSPLPSLSSNGKGVLVIGSEAHGISSEVLELLTHRVTIPGDQSPVHGHAESLNASIATAILCYSLTFGMKP